MVAGGAAAVGAAAWAGPAPTARAENLTTLRAAVRGRVVLPSDTQFASASSPWNLTNHGGVLAVVEIADAEDAAALVGYARDHGHALTTQLTGHGASAAANGTILVRTTRLNNLNVDPGGRSAGIGAGVSWEAVQAAAAPHALTGITGSSPHVGVTGYTLGGGLSWFGRAHGWAAAHVHSFDTVGADGALRPVTADSDAELFWALRGGGGDFALVTGINFDLQPAPAVYGGQMTWPAAHGAAVFAAFREVTAHAPDVLTVWCSRAQFPGAPPLVQMSCAFLGEEGAARQHLRPFELIEGHLADTRRPMSVAELGAITGEPQQPTPAVQEGTLLTELTSEVVAALLAEPLSPLLYLQVRHLGGRLAQPTATASEPVPEPYFVLLGGLNTSPSSTAALQSQLARFRDIVAPVDAHRTLFNFLAPSQTASDVFTAPVLSRLRQAKERYDPAGIFRSNFPVGA
jgi:FAD/FMN-containing dehydrogenase